MKIRIIREGIHNTKVGDEFEISTDLPEGWAKFIQIVGKDAPKEAVAITNPAQDPLDHDGDGRKGGSLPRRGRPPKGQ